MKGVILAIHPRARVVDLTHDIAPQDVTAAALLLRSAVRFFARGTVHLAVVDPGVGSTRRALVVVTRDALLVGPDNGLLQPAADALGRHAAYAIDVERLVKRKLLRAPISRTFHGRDVFAPVAAHLAKGLRPSAIGPAVEQMATLALPVGRVTPGGVEGAVIHIDHFGNCITNVTEAELGRFSGARLSVSLAGVTIRGIASAYSDAAEGAPLAIVNSWEHLEIAVRGGSAARQLGVERGARVHVAPE
jgi:hypothetical protein